MAPEATDRKASPGPDIVVSARETDPPALAARTRSVAWDIIMVVLLSGILLLTAATLIFVGPCSQVREKVEKRVPQWLNRSPEHNK
jgi:hypothetical protein